MKPIAFVWPLAAFFVLSAFNHASSKMDTSHHEQHIQGINIQTNSDTNISTSSDTNRARPTPAENNKAAEAPAPAPTLNNDSHKKDFIRFVYRDAAQSLRNNDKADDLNTVFAYADRNLQNAIALVKADAMNSYEGGEGSISTCNAVRFILHLSVGDGYRVNEAADIKYKVLDNGQVRVNILLHDDEDIESSDFDSYKDFSLSCSADGCKITDMFDSEGNSALQAVEDACR